MSVDILFQSLLVCVAASGALGLQLLFSLRRQKKTLMAQLRDLRHDLRTPLTSMTGAFEALRDHHHDLDEAVRHELFHMVETDLIYLRNLIEQLDVVTDHRRQSECPRTQRINLVGLLASEVRSRQAITTSGLHWEFMVSPELSPEIVGDAHALKRLFRNAFDNAARYAKELVRIELVAHDERIEVVVSDDGPGLTDASLATFGLAPQSETADSGLGSAIMRSIVELHDGMISIVNKAESGASLTITFPKP